MSRWTHTICDVCWQQREPNRMPIKLKPEYTNPAACCFCGAVTTDAISVREDPRDTPYCFNGEIHR
jgi:hypothetical protein